MVTPAIQKFSGGHSSSGHATGIAVGNDLQGGGVPGETSTSSSLTASWSGFDGVTSFSFL